MEGYASKTIKGTVIIFVFSLLASFFAYLFRYILAKNLSLSDFGFFFSLIALGGLFFLIKDIGMTQSIFYFIPRFVARKNIIGIDSLVTTVAKVSVFSSLLVSLLMMVFANFLVLHYFKTGSAFFIILYAIVFFINCLELLLQNLFSAFQDQFTYSVHNFSRNFLVVLFVSIGFLFFGHYGILVPLTSYLVSCAILLSFFGYLFYKKIFSAFRASRNRKSFDFKRLLLFGVPATLSSLGFLVITYADTLILTYFKPLEQVGLYNVAVPIITLMIYFPIAISLAIRPMSAELWIKREIKSLNFVIENTNKYALIVLLPAAALLCAYPDLVLRLLFGDKFVGASSALVILSIGAIFYGIAHININFIFGISGPKLTTYIWISAAILNVILNFVLIPKYGIVGAAIGTMMSYMLLFFLSAYFLFSKAKTPVNYLRYFLILVSGATFLSLINYLKKVVSLPIILESVMVGAFSILIYILLLFVFRVVTVSEIKSMNEKLFSK